MKRWITYWSVQDPAALPPWPLCAGHREAIAAPIEAQRDHWPEGTELLKKEVSDGVCALAAFGNCCDDPVTEIPSIAASVLDGLGGA